jgi:hypothetical protein
VAIGFVCHRVTLLAGTAQVRRWRARRAGHRVATLVWSGSHTAPGHEPSGRSGVINPSRQKLASNPE